MSAVRVVIISDGSVDPRVLETALASSDELQVVEVLADPQAWPSAGGAEHDAVVVASSGRSDSGLLDIVGRAAESPRPVVVMSTQSPNGLLRQVLDAGAADIVVVPAPALAAQELGFALQKAVARRVPDPVAHQPAQSQFVCVLGPKGGIGKTLTATNLAVAFAMAGKRALVIDLDLQFGDVGLVMGLHPHKTLFDLATAGGTLDAQKVDAFAMKHSSGARVLLAPIRPDQAAAVTPQVLAEVYEVMRDSVDVIIVDTPPGMTAEVIAAIDASTHVCLVGTLDAASLKNAKLGLETLELMNYPLDRVRLVLNRADSDVGISPDDVTQVLGRTPNVMVPSNRDVVRSVNAGEPIVMSRPRSDAARAFRSLAEQFIAAAEASAGRNGKPAARRRLFSRA